MEVPEYLKRYYKKKYENEVLPMLKNRICLKPYDFDNNRNIYLDNLFNKSNLTERLIISLSIWFHNRKMVDNKWSVSPFVATMISYRYICKKGYLDRVKKNDIKNKYYCKDMKKAPYTKFQSWKKEDLIKHIHQLEYKLWNREFIMRKYEMKYNIDNGGYVVFD